MLLFGPYSDFTLGVIRTLCIEQHEPEADYLT